MAKKKYYLNYGEEHNYSQKLTDRQFMLVDFVMGKFLTGIAREIDKTKQFLLWDQSTIEQSMNDALGGSYIDFWDVTENYEDWYDDDEKVVLANIRNSYNEQFGEDEAEPIRCDYRQWLQDEIESIKNELKEMRKEARRYSKMEGQLPTMGFEHGKPDPDFGETRTIWKK